MEPLIFDEKYLAGGSEPNRDKILYSGTFNFDGREDLQSAILYAGDRSYNLSHWIDWHERYYELGGPDSPCSAFNLHIWRSGSSEFSYELLLRDAYSYGTRPSDTNAFNDSFSIVAKFETGDDLSFSLPFSIICAPHYDPSATEGYLPVPHNINWSWISTIPDSVDWDFGSWENIYVPGDTRDPWRFQEDHDHTSTSFPQPLAHWGPTKDGSILLRAYEDALPPESMVNAEIEPRGYNIRNNVAGALLCTTDGGPRSVKVLYNNQEYELKEWNSTDPDTRIDMPGGTLIFDEFTATGDMACRFQLDENVKHATPTAIDVFNQKLTLQATFSGGQVATRDILVQIVDDVPIVSGEATMDMSSVAAWTLAGNKLPLSYDYLKDVLYRSVDYNDWATGFKVTNCEGKYGSIGVFGDDGNPDDPASAPGAAYYMVDPAKITFVAPDQAVTEVIEYTYTDSDGDTANGVLNIALKGTGLNPAEAIKITPHAGNVPTSGGDVPVDNPYVPGNPADPDRDLNSSGAGDYDPMNPNWGQDKDGNALMRVFESGLPNGSEAGQRNVTAHGYLDIDATVGLQSIVATTDGTDSYGFEDNIMNIPLNGGTLTLTQNQDEKYLKYEFTLTNPVMHETGNGINSDEQHVTLTATDNYGNVEAIGLEVQIIDDVPKPSPSDALHSFEYNSPLFAMMNIAFPVVGDLNPTNIMHPGADFNFGDGQSSIMLNQIDGNYGHFEITGNNNFDANISYTLDPEKIAPVKNGETVTESFSYTYIDADGDTATYSANYIFHGPGLRPEPHITVNEKDFANGAILNVEGFEIIGVNRQARYGVIAQDDNGTWRYNLSQSLNSGDVQGTNISQNADSFVLTVRFGLDNFETTVLGYIDIIDSVPTFTASQNRLAYDFGADNGPGSGLKVAIGGAETDLVPGIETMIAGQHGMLTLSPDGSCHYSPNSDYAGEDIFNFTITDSDGDRALAKVIASVVDGLPQTVISVQTADELAEIEALGVPDGDSGGFIGA